MKFFVQILHNIAVAEFLRDGCSDPRKLVDTLISVKVWVMIFLLDIACGCSQSAATQFHDC